MCGIAGIVGTIQLPSSRADAVERMNAAMLHRGPDEQGVFSSESAALGNRRLAIFDPGNGHQPMSSAEGGILSFSTERSTILKSCGLSSILLDRVRRPNAIRKFFWLLSSVGVSQRSRSFVGCLPSHFGITRPVSYSLPAILLGVGRGYEN